MNVKPRNLGAVLAGAGLLAVSVVATSNAAPFTIQQEAAAFEDGGGMTFTIPVQTQWTAITGLSFDILGDLDADGEFLDFLSPTSLNSARWLDGDDTNNGAFTLPTGDTAGQLGDGAGAVSAVATSTGVTQLDGDLGALTQFSFSLNASNDVQQLSSDPIRDQELTDNGFEQFVSTLNDGETPAFVARATLTGEETTNVVPLPATLPMLGLGLIALGVVGWRRRRGAPVVSSIRR